MPVFGVGGHNGDVFCYRALAARLGSDQPFFGLEPPGLDGRCEPLMSVEELGAYFADQVRAFRPAGPCVIAGYCAGGAIAFELAQRLRQQGTPVSFVALFAGRYPAWFRALPQMRHRIVHYKDRAGTHAHALATSSNSERRRYLAGIVERFAVRTDPARFPETDPVAAVRGKVRDATMIGIRRYTPKYFPGRLAMFLPSAKSRRAADGLLRWRRLAQEAEELCGPAGCEGDEMLLEPHVAIFADLFRRCCDRHPQ
jgi:thioesterase domain-containing protein